MRLLNYNRGVTLMELMCCVAISSLLAVAFAGGLLALRTVQYRSNATARLTSAATAAMEEWSVRAARGEMPGAEWSEPMPPPNSRPMDHMTIEVRDVEDKPDLREIVVRATHPDVRLPVEIELRTFVAVGQ